ncbi:unnamed protein product [Mesocestoides corti]|uniref:Neurotransmitter-gated ion-channel ligand-binding domain-containing protein n=1 Tax=Mesocestoides corti TaxID=53468 RepID=A0A3P6HQN7_MESCO|nr:unnamed protein product [Mesocestoides corti]
MWYFQQIPLFASGFQKILVVLARKILPESQVIKTQAWVEQEWNDPQLVWDPAEFDGILSIHVPAEDIWRPDIVLYNNVDGKYEITTLTRAEVFFNGTVRWMPPALYLSFCRIDMEYFPYDEQTCSMRFGSWTYDDLRKPNLRHNLLSSHSILVELRHHLQKYAPELSRPLHIDYAADLYNFGSTVEYDIVSVSAICQDQDYKHSLHPEVTFYLRMRRRTIFYTFNLMLPCVAITTLAVVTFYLPPECREKISLSITIFLSLSLFFLLISETTPPTSLAVPLIGKYLLFTIVLITSSIMVTVMVLNIHFRSDETHTMDLWTRRVFLEILPPLLGLHAPKQRRPPESHKVRKVRSRVFNFNGTFFRIILCPFIALFCFAPKKQMTKHFKIGFEVDLLLHWCAV